MFSLGGLGILLGQHYPSGLEVSMMSGTGQRVVQGPGHAFIPKDGMVEDGAEFQRHRPQLRRSIGIGYIQSEESYNVWKTSSEAISAPFAMKPRAGTCVER